MSAVLEGQVIESSPSSFVFRQDPDAETVLRYVGVEYAIKDIDFSAINWDESANNCARLFHPLNDEKITDYETAFRAGDVFPMIVIENTKAGYVILGGNQRANALKRIGCDSIEAYIVKPLTTHQREMIIRSLNARHGWGSDKKERVEHAAYLVHNHGVSVKDAARLLLVSEPTIFKKIRVDNTRAELARAGVDSNKLNDTQIDAVSRVSDEDFRRELASVVERFQPSAESVANAARSIETAGNRAAMATKLKAFSKDCATSESISKTTGTGHQRPRRDKFYRLLESLSEFLERGNAGSGFSTLDELQCTEQHDGDKVRMLVGKVTIRLNGIARTK